MTIRDLHTTKAVLAELGQRVEQHRLARNWTQERLAERAGIGRATLQRLERGDAAQMSSWVKVLRALDLLDGLDVAVPPRAETPIEALRRQDRPERRRASPTRGADPGHGDDDWTWDEP